APPATLFGGGLADGQQGAALPGSRATVLPEQVVDAQGFITVPFAGRVPAAGRDVQAIQADIVARLRTKAHAPEAIVRVSRNSSSVVTVVGEVTNSLRVPLTPSGERVLDALAAAGGVRQPVNKTTLQLTRGADHVSLPLDRLIRDPGQNIRLRAGDVLTAMNQPLSFTALGATGKNEEIAFETQGLSLAQALARSGGLLDTRSDAQGVFVFRLEPQAALDWPRQPVFTTAENMVPVVYRLNLREPAGFFAMQGFAVQDKDVLYVSNAPLSEVQKFLNLVFSVAYPVLNLVQVAR
ncbi:MAG: polysaccharide biosynthesis/export family protein, partial [Burkholderiaceae bacterium]